MSKDPDPTDVADDELMRRTQENDLDAFERLYDRYGALAYRVARAVCRDQACAEDAVQDGFMSIWRGRSSYDPARGSFKSWSLSIVRHRAVDLDRRETTSSRTGLAAANHAATLPPSGSAEDSVLARDHADVLRASIARLPDAQAEVIALAFYGELTHAEIAQRLSIPPGTVKGRMRLGLEKLRRQMSA